MSAVKRVDNQTIMKTRQAVESAFAGQAPLARLDQALSDNMSDERWKAGITINRFQPQAFQLMVQDILVVANGQGWFPEILSALNQSAPGNADFEQLLQEASQTASVGAPLARLEQILPDTAIAAFPTLFRRMRMVCRVDYADRSPPGAGTGFLIGPDIVLTNHHVAKRAIETPGAAGQMRFRFDLTDPTAAADAGGRVCNAAPGLGEAILRHSPPGGLELPGGIGEPSLAELDFAVIRLAEPVGAEMIEGSERGFVSLAPDMPGPQPGGPLIALQHPLRGELQFAVGSVLGPNEVGSRTRHTAATEEGSSGSLIVDHALAGVVLHNGTRSGSGLDQKPYNTGVPLALIAADLRDNGQANLLRRI